MARALQVYICLRNEDTGYQKKSVTKTLLEIFALVKTRMTKFVSSKVKNNGAQDTI